MRTGRESAPFLLHGGNCQHATAGRRPPSGPDAGSYRQPLAVRRRGGRRGLIAIRHMGASQRRHRGQRQQDRAEESLRHACPLRCVMPPDPGPSTRVRKLSRLYRRDGPAASAGCLPHRRRASLRFAGESRVGPVTSPAQKGSIRCSDVTPALGTPALPLVEGSAICPVPGSYIYPQRSLTGLAADLYLELKLISAQLNRECRAYRP
ncbi:Uncharacterised protein [Achromobacter sp. 2789STDY5608633]|jgi:hypothetical protein|nr:Uncharacterised protein [Achromobacter sp. 2789STDY5608633]